MVNVKFQKHHAPYNAGEIASFSDEMARRLITRKIASAHPAAAQVNTLEGAVVQEAPKAEGRKNTGKA